MKKVERKKWYHKLFRPLLNAAGTLKGVCFVCGDRWNWKMSHNVQYDEHGGYAFPTCEECWQTRCHSEIVDAANRLAALWIAQASYINWAETWSKAKAMVEAVDTAACKRA